MIYFKSDPDEELGKVVKISKKNPTGEDVFLNPDGSISKDETKIVKIQRLFKHHFYKPGGKGYLQISKKYVPSETPISDQN